jgi:hypothetical protein
LPKISQINEREFKCSTKAVLVDIELDDFDEEGDPITME